MPAISPKVSWTSIPLWRGFNLLEKFGYRGTNKPFDRKWFDIIRELGFNFIRLPMDYRCWTGGDIRSTSFREDAMKDIDDAIEWGRDAGIHICINFHRAPGYCINPPVEPLDLWTSGEAQEICSRHWAYFSERYKGIPSEALTFNLFNEPIRVGEEAYLRVCGMMIDAIRSRDPERVIIVDGLEAGRIPLPSLVKFKVVQATRGYSPHEISHYQAPWVPEMMHIKEPTWPLADPEWNGQRLKDDVIAPWRELRNSGPAVMVGEWGVFNRTPHDVALAWMEDYLKLWKAEGWGWALWNLAGTFGFLDSGRKDVVYENYKGFKLDRRMLELIKAY